ncbi:MAG: hypothetical protein FWD68_17150 [Alphaproteobacteria bacterium]|nr:hypothetical protein [Alphaproteobacteria bacterium]
MIQRLLAGGPEGNIHRSKLMAWRKAEHQPVTFYRGGSNFCWLDPPSLMTDDSATPLAGLFLTPDIRIFLDPVDSQDLFDHMTAAVDKAIAKWISRRNPPGCRLYPIPVTTVPFRQADEPNAPPCRSINRGCSDITDAWSKDPDNA